MFYISFLANLCSSEALGATQGEVGHAGRCLRLRGGRRSSRR